MTTSSSTKLTDGRSHSKKAPGTSRAGNLTIHPAAPNSNPFPTHGGHSPAQLTDLVDALFAPNGFWGRQRP